MNPNRDIRCKGLITTVKDEIGNAINLNRLSLKEAAIDLQLNIIYPCQRSLEFEQLRWKAAQALTET